MPDTRPPNKRKQQAAATRERMLNAAREVFETSGYRGTTIGAITKAARTAHGTFYLYFKNKDDAFLQVMLAVGKELRDAQRIEPSHNRYVELQQVLHGFVGVFVQHPGLWRALLEGMLQSELIRSMWLRTRHGFFEELAARLEREHDAGILRDLNARQAAVALGSMAEWYAFTHLVLETDGQPTEQQIDEAVRTLADLWYHALYP